MSVNGNVNIEQTGKVNLKAILKMLFSFICIIVFVIFLAPEVDKLEIVKPMVNNIDEKGIDASALFYTEIDEFSTAELKVNTSLKYSPVKKLKILHSTNQ